jgi:nucleoside 2-deoxyribosyltransferase
MRIYLAGPLFTTAERDFNARLADRLRRLRHEVFLPQEHEPRAASAAAIFAENVAGIDGAQVVVANMDGPDPDSGTSWECGYAYGRKPVLMFRTDFRAIDEAGKAPYNLMLTESAAARLDLAQADVDAVARRIDEAIKRLAAHAWP